MKFSDLTDKELIEKAESLKSGAGVSDWMGVFREVLERFKAKHPSDKEIAAKSKEAFPFNFQLAAAWQEGVRYLRDRK